VITQRESREYSFAQKMVGLPKVVFSKTVDHVEGQNVRVEKGRTPLKLWPRSPTRAASW
jgi:hypothetical protein